MTDELQFITLADIERQIEQHRDAIRDLCEAGVRTGAASEMSDWQAIRWLREMGYGSELQCQSLVVRVVRENQAARADMSRRE